MSFSSLQIYNSCCDGMLGIQLEKDETLLNGEDYSTNNRYNIRETSFPVLNVADSLCISGELDELMSNRQRCARFEVYRNITPTDEDFAAESANSTVLLANDAWMENNVEDAIEFYLSYLESRKQWTILHDCIVRSNLSCLYLKVFDYEKAAFFADSLIHRYPAWPMGYVRKYEVFLKQENFQAAALALIGGVENIRKYSSTFHDVPLLVRLRNARFTDSYVFKNSAYLIVSEKYDENKVREIKASISGGGGVDAIIINNNGHSRKRKPNHQQQPSSLDMSINCSLTAPSLSELEILSVFTPDQIPCVLKFGYDLFRASNLQKMEAEEEKRNIFWDDILLILGAGMVEVNGLYFPQGTRNEMPYYENRWGCFLSKETSANGSFAWIIGNLTENGRREVVYVHEPSQSLFTFGNDSAKWKAAAFPMLLPPRVVKMVELVPSLKKLQLSLVLKGEMSSNTTTFTTTTRSLEEEEAAAAAARKLPYDLLETLLMVKGHALRWIENGYFDKADACLNWIIQKESEINKIDRGTEHGYGRIVKDCVGILKQLQSEDFSSTPATSIITSNGQLKNNDVSNNNKALGTIELNKKLSLVLVDDNRYELKTATSGKKKLLLRACFFSSPSNGDRDVGGKRNKNLVQQVTKINDQEVYLTFDHPDRKQLKVKLRHTQADEVVKKFKHTL